MFFNSLSFAIFLPIVFLLYWLGFKKTKTSQNTLLVVASYFFYACWDWRFLFLLIFSTLLDFFCAWQIEKNDTSFKRKFWFWITISINLSFLGVFKYFDFFATSFTVLLEGFGLKVQPILLDLVLPVGISFYTFHGLSYIIDVYYKRMLAERKFLDYALFVSYFPLLVAGPIERASHLLPQIKQKRTFNFHLAKEGINQIIWGLIKKIVIADSCASYANAIFDHHENLNTSTLLLGAIYFSFQIYGDFSGYTDIALGTSKLFGIKLLKNFDYPYFSRDIAEFWRKWHISLSSWFRDYLYIPLGGSKGSLKMKIQNTFIIFLVSGFWHGANWTFLAWGLLHALFFLPLLLNQKNRKNLNEISIKFNFNGFATILSMIITFLSVSFAWIFFRASTIKDAFTYIKRLFNNGEWSIQYLVNERYNIELILLLLIFISVEWNHRDKVTPLMGKYYIIKLFLALLVLLIFGVYSDYKEFIYFQF